MASTLDLARLAMEVYQDRTIDGWTKIDIELTGPDAPPGTNPDSGFFARVYENQAANEVVIAFRGSEFLKPDPKDYEADVAIIEAAYFSYVLKGEGFGHHQQFVDAMEFARKVRDKYRGTDFTISVTGHSLGGTLAQLVADAFHWGGATFAAPGSKELSIPPALSQFDDFYAANPDVDRFDHFAEGLTDYAVKGGAISATGTDVGEFSDVIDPAVSGFSLVGMLAGWGIGGPVAAALLGFFKGQLDRHGMSGLYEALKAESEAGRLLQELTRGFVNNGVDGYSNPHLSPLGLFKGWFDGIPKLTQAEAESLLGQMQAVLDDNPAFNGPDTAAVRADLVAAMDEVRKATQGVVSVTASSPVWTEYDPGTRSIEVTVTLKHALQKEAQTVLVELPAGSRDLYGNLNGFNVEGLERHRVENDEGTMEVEHFYVTVPAGEASVTLTFTAVPDEDDLDRVIDGIVFRPEGRPSETAGKTISLRIGDQASKYAVVITGDPDDNQLSAGGDYPVEIWGEAGSDRLKGGEHGDHLLGGSGNDFLEGFGGDDVLHGGDDGDQLSGGEGVDSLYGEAGRDDLSGGEGDDRLDGGTENDSIFGGYGNDTLYGGDGWDGLFGDDEGPAALSLRGVTHVAGNDVLYGGPGNDVLEGGYRDDTLFGGDDHDLLFGDFSGNTLAAGNDYLNGGEGDDLLFGGGGDDTLVGATGADFLEGEQGDDLLHGNAGSDQIFGGEGDDVIWGGPDGDTVLIGGDGMDIIYGEGGADELQGNGGADLLYGGDGDDTLFGDGAAEYATTPDGDDLLSGGAGNDNISGNDGNDTLYGDDGDDALFGDDGDDSLFGGAGMDTASGGAGADLIYGGLGDDILQGDGAADRLYGEAGNDNLQGGDGDDLLSGGPGIDELYGETGNDTLFGGDGSDTLFGEAGADVLSGGAGDDGLVGGDGDDRLRGDAGNDILLGEVGKDMLDGGPGDDILMGGDDDDVYRVERGDGVDSIVDEFGANAVEFGAGIRAADLAVTSARADDGSSYLVVHFGPEDALAIRNGLAGHITEYRFDDGTVLTHEELVGSAPVPLEGGGTPGDDTLGGGPADDRLQGHGGDDSLAGGGGNDSLQGGEGNDMLSGGDGDDLLDGGTGDDRLEGGSGLDTYVIEWGMGQDRILDADGGVLKLQPGVTTADLALQADGPDWQVSFRGTDDGVRIQGGRSQAWFVEGEDGVRMPLADAIAGPMVPVTLEDEMGAYADRARGLFLSVVRADGFAPAGADFLTKVENSLSGTPTTSTTREARWLEVEQTADDMSIERQTQPFTREYTLLSETTVRRADTRIRAGGRTLSAVSGGSFVGTGAVPASGVRLTADSVAVAVYGNRLDGGAGSLVVDDYASLAADTRLLGHWVYDAGTANASSVVSSLPQTVVTHREGRSDEVRTLERITAGASDNTITTSGFSIVDAGAGNDLIEVQGDFYWELSYGQPAFEMDERSYDRPLDPRNVGAFLYGNDGDDTLKGGRRDDILVGGNGSDALNGGKGSDRYVIRREDTGMDIVADSGRAPNGLGFECYVTESRYTDWYIRSQGPSSGLPPVIARNDYAALQPLIDAGVVEKDVIEFGPGVALDNLEVSWGEVVPSRDMPELAGAWPEADSVHATLDIRLPTGGSVRVVIPHALDPFDEEEGGLLPGGGGCFGDDARYLALVAQDLGIGIEGFEFADGSSLTMLEMMQRAGPVPSLDPQLLDNRMEGTAGDDRFDGMDGNDTLIGRGGRDILDGGPGNDTLDGGAGDDVLAGGGGDDVYRFDIGGGNDVIRESEGATGVDVLRMGAGITPSDLLAAQDGTDLLITHVNGQESVTIRGWFGNYAPEWHRLDRVEFESTVGRVGWSEAELTALSGVPRVNADLSITDFDDRMLRSAEVTVTGFDAGKFEIRYDAPAGIEVVFDSGTGRLDLSGAASKADYATALRSVGIVTRDGVGHDGGSGELRFRVSDGQDWSDTAVAAWSLDPVAGEAGPRRLVGTNGPDVLQGGAGNDRLLGRNGDDHLLGGGGADKLRGGRDDDVLEGGPGEDRLVGGRGDDDLAGGADNDRLLGGPGDDTYRFRAGGGRDVIREQRGEDRLVFEELQHDQLWLERIGRDLQVGIIGRQDSVRIKGWYRSDARQVDVIEAGGYELFDTQVDLLVQAMASLTPPGAGDLELSPELRAELEPVLASAWQPAA